MKIPSQNQYEQKRELYDAFKENLIGWTKKTSATEAVEAVDKARILSIPGPAQYMAFSKFFSFIKGGMDFFDNRVDGMLYDDTGKKGLPAIMRFLSSLDESDIRGRLITLSLGTLWADESVFKEEGEMRRWVFAGALGRVYAMGGNVRLHTTAKDFEALPEGVRKHARLGLPHSSFIHFAMVGASRLFFEFPHSKSTLFRLADAVDLDEIQYANSTNKYALCNFFNGLLVRNKHQPSEKRFVHKFLSTAAYERE